MKLATCAAQLALFLCAPLAAAAAPIVVMAEDASEPFSRADGSGYANDLVRAAFSAAGVDIRLDVVPYARCKDYLLRAKVPACLSMSSEPGLSPQIAFSRLPLFTVYADVYRNPHAAYPVRSLQDLGPKSAIGVINGYEYPPEIKALAQKGVRVERNVDNNANLRMLGRGRLDAVILMTSEFNRGPQRMVDAGTPVATFAFRIGSMKSYIAFNLSHPAGKAAHDGFNRGFAIITATHETDRIRRRWIKLTSSQNPH
jgi:polar amino acid transport system substrate-binding protein